MICSVRRITSRAWASTRLPCAVDPTPFRDRDKQGQPQLALKRRDSGHNCRVTSADASDRTRLDSVRVDLDSTGQAPAQARRAVQRALLAWRLPALVDTVVLAVSELVTNAVRYGRPPVCVVLQRDRQEVHLDVHDGSPREPAGPRRTSVIAESGRGMNIVHALAEQVDCEQIPDDGKIVHATFGAARSD